MDAKFHPAQVAIVTDNAEELERLVRNDPSLATERSRCSHPTLLCCLVLEMPPRRSLAHLIALFAELGADLNDPLLAAASIGNDPAIETLLDLGAHISAGDAWSPLDEALYWRHITTTELLLRRGAPVDNLRKYAALGKLDGVRQCFDEQGALKPNAGTIDWPFGGKFPDAVRHDPRQIINNALVYAAAWGEQATASELLARGAEVNAIPAGFDFAGTPLHYAALNNQRAMVDWLLEHGADPTIRDHKVHLEADGWADYAKHTDLAAYLRTARGT